MRVGRPVGTLRIADSEARLSAPWSALAWRLSREQTWSSNEGPNTGCYGCWLAPVPALLALSDSAGKIWQ